MRRRCTVARETPSAAQTAAVMPLTGASATTASVKARRRTAAAAGYCGNGADVDLYERGDTPIRAEVKAYGTGDGFRTLERWLGGSDALFLWRDRAAPFVVLPLHVWLEIAERSATRKPDADTDRRARCRDAEQGPLAPSDAIAGATAPDPSLANLNHPLEKAC